jgi:uncharacterized protein (TIGR03437 family)
MKPFVVCLLAVAPVWAQISPQINGLPSRQFGHATLLNPVPTASPNLLEGRELFNPSAIAFDTSVSPPILYVSDTNNFRVLAWRNAEGLNRGDPADRVIGQRNFFSTTSNGPGTSFVTGFSVPSGIAVDRSGNLYVADAGNNRILRFPPPFQQQGELIPDLVIGQRTVSSGNLPNQGLAAPTAKTVAFNRGSGVRQVGLAFDPQGNLWITDPLNHRVLRYPVSQLAANTVEPAADLVLGQFNFTDNAPPAFPNNKQDNRSALVEPGSLAFDSRGGLYVADLIARVLYFQNPNTIGAAATRILGIRPTPPQGQQPPPYPTEYTLGFVSSSGQLIAPQCVFTFGEVVFVCDTPFHRIVRYGAPETWPAATNEVPSPPAAAVYGQEDMRSGKANRGVLHPANNGFSGPVAGAFLNGEMWIAESFNHRVMAFPQGPSSNPAFQFPAARAVVGQVDFQYNAPNLVEGKELFIASANARAGAVIVDKTSTPHHLYIADTFNNRVLGFRDVRKVGVDARGTLQVPDPGDLIVIGQPDRFHTTINYPSEDPLLPTDTGLFSPAGLAVDQFGNLYVADTSNGRVLRFPAPFNQPPGTVHRSNLVLGQPNFTTKIQQASAATMSAPRGVVLFSNGSLAVSDSDDNRVLIFRRPGADFSSGQAAQVVLGQQNFESTAPSSTQAGLNGPRALAVDTSDRLYVADRNNNRIVVYSNTAQIANGATGTTVSSSLSAPEGVAVSSATGEIWVASSGNNNIYRFREFTQLLLDPTPTSSLVAFAPLAVALDAFDNVIAADSYNRMIFYYAELFRRHSATYASGVAVTPNQILLIARRGKDFAFEPAVASSTPYPLELGGLQLLVDGVPAPIYRVDPAVIYAIIPNNARQSGFAEFLVTRPATGEIVAAGNFLMAAAAPGFYTSNQAGTGQIAAVNQDGSINGPANPIDRGQTMQLYLTGHGHIPGLPPDGEPAGRAISTPTTPTIILNAQPLPPANILYSGVSPQFPGLWQINIRIPDVGAGGPAPGNNSIIVIMNDQPSNIVGTSTIGTDRQAVVGGGITTIAVK